MRMGWLVGWSIFSSFALGRGGVLLGLDCEEPLRGCMGGRRQDGLAGWVGGGVVFNVMWIPIGTGRAAGYIGGGSHT
jgi:hypothetical protein